MFSILYIHKICPYLGIPKSEMSHTVELYINNFKTFHKSIEISVSAFPYLFMVNRRGSCSITMTKISTVACCLVPSTTGNPLGVVPAALETSCTFLATCACGL